MEWNHRIVNLSNTDGGGPWYEVREVYFEDDGSVVAHTRPCLGDEDPEQIVSILQRMIADIRRNSAVITPPEMVATQDAVARAMAGRK